MYAYIHACMHTLSACGSLIHGEDDLKASLSSEERAAAVQVRVAASICACTFGHTAAVRVILGISLRDDGAAGKFFVGKSAGKACYYYFYKYYHYHYYCYYY